MSSLSLISVLRSTIQIKRPYHRFYIVFQYVMMKIYNEIDLILNKHVDVWPIVLIVKYFKVTCKKKLFISNQFTYEGVTKQDFTWFLIQ